MASNVRRRLAAASSKQQAASSSKQAASSKQQAAASKQQATGSKQQQQAEAVAWIMPAAASGWHKLTAAALQQRIDEAYRSLPAAARGGFQRQLAAAGLPAASKIKRSASGKRQANGMGKRRGDVATALAMLRFYSKLCSQWPLSTVEQAVWDWRDQQLDTWLQAGSDLISGKRQAASGGQQQEQQRQAAGYSEQRRQEFYSRLEAKRAAEQERAAAAVKPEHPAIASLLQQARADGYQRQAASSGIASILAGLVKMQRQEAAAPSGEVGAAMTGILAMRQQQQQERAASGKVQAAAPSYRPATGKAEPTARDSGLSYAEFKLKVWASMAVFWQEQLTRRWSAFAAERFSRCGMQMQHWDYVRRQQQAA